MPDGGVVVVARDVSAQREVDDLKSDFLATVSHELRTPLTPIQGFLQTLLRDDASFGDEERHRFYEVMLRQSERLERLIKDLLDATSLQDKDHLFFPEQVDWTGSATRVVELFRRQDPTRAFELHVEHDVPDVVVDEQRAEQVLSNLLSNAVKYSPPRAAVTVTIGHRDDEVVTTVTDRGPGIDPGEREKVFERFTRLGNHLTRTVGGAGLGLFIARRLVEGMGGTITVGSAPTGGASFSFTLPAAARAPYPTIAP
jgi:signal transduction histidine kinase